MGHTETYTIFAALVKQSKSPELPLSPTGHEPSAFPPAPGQADSIAESHERTQDITDLVPETRPASDVREATREQINTAGEPLREELVPESVGDVLTTEDTEQKESLTNLSLDGAICGPPNLLMKYCLLKTMSRSKKDQCLGMALE
ncbi:hypothetical protein Leryth_012837 [Lithospermum erythrorhizon]|nr:hypothetical protein Leryth_012837 [Lithospermum erythrorhizon]